MQQRNFTRTACLPGLARRSRPGDVDDGHRTEQPQLKSAATLVYRGVELSVHHAAVVARGYARSRPRAGGNRVEHALGGVIGGAIDIQAPCLIADRSEGVVLDVDVAVFGVAQPLDALGVNL